MAEFDAAAVAAIALAIHAMPVMLAEQSRTEESVECLFLRARFP